MLEGPERPSYLMVSLCWGRGKGGGDRGPGMLPQGPLGRSEQRCAYGRLS